MKITALYFPDDITLMFTLSPILTSGYASCFDFVQTPEDALRSRNKVIVLFRFMRFRERIDGRAFLEKLRQKYERVVYFDDFADPRDVMGDLIDLVDIYFKKQLLVDRSLYRQTAYGRRYFTDRYHKAFGIDDERPSVAPALTDADIAKLRLSWNLGLGSYPKNRIRKGLCMRLGKRNIVRPIGLLLANPASFKAGRPVKRLQVSARFRAAMDQNTVVFHRQQFIDEMARRPDLFLTGLIPLEEYNREMNESIAALSPFGWGEICFRDFEAVLNRTVLLKPNMDHIETWPNIYQAGKTYVSLDWDAKDLLARTDEIIADGEKRSDMIEAAYESYMDGVRGSRERARRFVEEISR